MTKESVTQMERIFGIDLGTTNSVIAYTDPTGTTEVIAGQDGNRIVPSVVYFGKDGTQLVGTSARQRAIIEPERVAMLFKRGMGEKTFLDDEQPFVVDGKTWSPEELSASVLKKLALTAAGAVRRAGPQGGDHRARVLRRQRAGGDQVGRGDRRPRGPAHRQRADGRRHRARPRQRQLPAGSSSSTWAAARSTSR